jgi:amidohydrolase family protein
MVEEMSTDSDIVFFDTCVRIGRSRAPDPPGNAADLAQLSETMQRLHIASAAVEHAVAMESSPHIGHDLLDEALAGREELRPAWHLMPAISDRIERPADDPDELIARRVALGRVDARDFCQGKGDQACFGPVLDACSEIRLPVAIDFRRQGDATTFDFAICERYPRIPFLIEGVGGYPLHRTVWCLREYPNCFLSTVGLSVFNGVAVLCELVGAGKLIFGSNYPARSAGMALGTVLLAGIDDESRRRIAGGNFIALLDRIGRDRS